MDTWYEIERRRKSRGRLFIIFCAYVFCAGVLAVGVGAYTLDLILFGLGVALALSAVVVLVMFLRLSIKIEALRRDWTAEQVPQPRRQVGIRSHDVNH